MNDSSINWDRYWKETYGEWVGSLQMGITDDWCKNTERDVDFLETVWQENRPSHILDVSCGWGRHVIELHKRGYKVTGLDYSFPLLKLAKTLANAAGLSIPLLIMDRRKIWWEEKFDAVLQMYDAPWSGFWETKDEHLQYLYRVYRALKPGGYFITGATDHPLTAETAIRNEKKYMTSKKNGTGLLDPLIEQKKFNYYSYEDVRSLLDASLFAVESEYNTYVHDSGYKGTVEGLVLVCRALKTTVEIWVYTRNPEIEVLLLRRTRKSGWGNVFWQPITGTIDMYETPQQAAIRELKEESGITSWLQFTDSRAPSHFKTDGLGTLHKTMYAVEVEKQPITIDQMEHDAHQWVSLDRVAEMLYWDSNREGLKTFSGMISSGLL